MKLACGEFSGTVILLFASFAIGQSGGAAIPISPKNSGSRIRQAFSKAALKALLTIEGTKDNSLVDAAMIDVSAAQLTHAELTVVWHIQLFQQIYAINEAARNHDDDHRCIVAWVPKLRSFSAEIPKQCPRLTAEEMSKMTKP